jgi:hypothetical protein
MTKSHAAEFVSSLPRNGRNALRVILAHEDGPAKLREALGMPSITVYADRATGLARVGRTIELFCMMIVVMALLPVHAAAKDKPTLQTATVQSARVNAGWIDTTRCSGEPGYVACSGGIQDTFDDIHLLVLANGSKVQINHAMGRPDSINGLADGTSVQFYTKQHMGVTYYVVISPTTGKEGWYYHAH